MWRCGRGVWDSVDAAAHQGWALAGTFPPLRHGRRCCRHGWVLALLGAAGRFDAGCPLSRAPSFPSLGSRQPRWEHAGSRSARCCPWWQKVSEVLAWAKPAVP